MGAVAKGVPTRSRVGGRLEPLSHVEIVLHSGRGELATVGAVELLDSAEAVRGDAYRLGVALVGIEAVTRLFPEPDEPNEALFDGLLRFLHVVGEYPGSRRRTAATRSASRSRSSCWRWPAGPRASTRAPPAAATRP